MAPLNMLRFVGLFLSLSIVLFFNFNWIFGRPATVWLFVVSLILSMIIAKFGNIFEISKHKNIKDLSIFIFFGFILLLSCASYFSWRLDEPKYTTEDAAIHYLYMSQTVKTGFLSNFLPNTIYFDSGENEVYKNFGKGYPPGAAVPFYLIYNIVPTRHITASLQIFNSIFFTLSILYIFFLVKKSGILRFRTSLIFMSLIFGFGAFFDFITASFSTQVFGLFLLLFFFDTYRGFFEEKMNIIFSILALSSIVFSYIYWFPVASLFMCVYFLSNRNFPHPFIVFVVTTVLSAGYIKELYDVRILNYATAYGYFESAKIFLSDIAFILPLAIFGLIGIIRDIFRKENVFIGSIVLSSILYAFVLLILFRFDVVSQYPAFKSLLLAVPLIWLVGLIQIEKIYKKRREIRNDLYRMYDCGFSFLKKDILIVSCIFLSLVVILVFAWFSKVPIGVMPIIFRNTHSIVYPRNFANITAEQLLLLDKLKTEYARVLDERRILVIAPFDTSLWVYAYSGIWPRTFSLLGNEKNFGEYSPMDVYSNDIVNYETWLKNDVNHVLVLFDNEFNRDWQARNNFHLEDYEILFSVGNNYILQLKKSVEVEFFHQKNQIIYTFTPSISLPEKKKQSIPYSGEIITLSETFIGLSFMLSIKKEEISEDLFFDIRSGKCNENGSIFYKKTVSIEELRNQKKGDYYLIRFDSPVKISIGSPVCYSLYQDRPDDSIALVALKESETPLVKELYLFKNR